MSAIYSPTFKNGLNTYCLLASALHQIKRVGGKDALTFYQLLHSPHYLYIDMVSLVDRQIKQIDSHLVVRTIWERFFNASDSDALWKAKTEMEDWLQQYTVKTADLPADFKDTPIVVVTDKEKKGRFPTNALTLPLVHAAHTSYTVICSFIDFKGDAPFNERVKSDLRQLLACQPGRNLINQLIHFLNLKRVMITIEPDQASGAKGLKVFLDLKMVSCVFETEKGKKSAHVPTEIALAHELCHVLHFLEGLSCEHYSADSPFTNSEEDRTIKDEQAFLEVCNLPHRYGHIAGCSFELAPKINLLHAFHNGIELDYAWIIPTIERAELLPLFTEIFLRYQTQPTIPEDLSELSAEELQKQVLILTEHILLRDRIEVLAKKIKGYISCHEIMDCV